MRRMVKKVEEMRRTVENVGEMRRIDFLQKTPQNFKRNASKKLTICFRTKVSEKCVKVYTNFFFREFY